MEGEDKKKKIGGRHKREHLMLPCSCQEKVKSPPALLRRWTAVSVLRAANKEDSVATDSATVGRMAQHEAMVWQNSPLE